MQIKDIGFVQAGEIVRAIETAAQVKGYGSNRVHTYKLSAKGLTEKLAMMALLEANRVKITAWGKKSGRSKETVCIARSMYQTYGHAFRTCQAHAETIRAYLEGSPGDV